MTPEWLDLDADETDVLPLEDWRDPDPVEMVPARVQDSVLGRRNVKLLRIFWGTLENYPTRLQALQRWARMDLRDYPGAEPVMTRRERRMMLYAYPAAGACWACRRLPAVDRHHIVAVRYGGLTFGLNRVDLCSDCHQRAHR